MLSQEKIMEPIMGIGKTQLDMSMQMWNTFQKNWGQMMNIMVDQGYALQTEAMKTMTDWVSKSNEAREKLMNQLGENWMKSICQSGSGSQKK